MQWWWIGFELNLPCLGFGVCNGMQVCLSTRQFDYYSYPPGTARWMPNIEMPACLCLQMSTQMQMLNQNANAQCSQVSPHNAPMPMQNARICIAMLRCQKAKWSKVIANANAAASNPKLKYQSKAKCKMLKYPLQNCQNANAKHSLTCQLHCSTLSTLKCLNVKK